MASWGGCWAAGPGLVAVAAALSLVTGPLASVTAWSTKLMVDRLISHQPGPVVAAAVAALTVAGLVGTIAPGRFRAWTDLSGAPYSLSLIFGLAMRRQRPHQDHAIYVSETPDLAVAAGNPSPFV